jgi:hypothetical protein
VLLDLTAVELVDKTALVDFAQDPSVDDLSRAVLDFQPLRWFI